MISKTAKKACKFRNNFQKHVLYLTILMHLHIYYTFYKHFYFNIRFFNTILYAIAYTKINIAYLPFKKVQNCNTQTTII